jgi:hypothetical protein
MLERRLDLTRVHVSQPTISNDPKCHTIVAGVVNRCAVVMSGLSCGVIGARMNNIPEDSTSWH